MPCAEARPSARMRSRLIIVMIVAGFAIVGRCSEFWEGGVQVICFQFSTNRGTNLVLVIMEFETRCEWSKSTSSEKKERRTLVESREAPPQSCLLL